MIFEMHCHTAEHSACSHIDAASLARLVLDKGLDEVNLTDHHYLWGWRKYWRCGEGLGCPPRAAHDRAGLAGP